MAAVLNLAEGAAPGTPAAGTHNLYPDTSHDWHILDDEGNDRTLATTDYQFDTAGLADEAVTNAKLAQMEEGLVKGRADGAGTGAVTDLDADDLATILAGKFLEASDSGWINFSSLATGYYTTATLYPSEHTYAVPGYRKLNGVVYLRGAVRTAAASVSAAMSTLPEGYRPGSDFAVAIAVASSTSRTTGLMAVTDAGEVFLPGTGSATTFHLDGVCFPAA